jgi:hypothetical protein
MTDAPRPSAWQHLRGYAVAVTVWLGALLVLLASWTAFIGTIIAMWRGSR